MALECKRKSLAVEFGNGALATHAVTEASIVFSTASQLANQTHHALRAIRLMGFQPRLEQGRDLQREPEGRIPGVASAGVRS